MKIKLVESDLINIINKVIKEQGVVDVDIPVEDEDGNEDIVKGISMSTTSTDGNFKDRGDIATEKYTDSTISNLENLMTHIDDIKQEGSFTFEIAETIHERLLDLMEQEKRDWSDIGAP
tara:strand:- start:390 stop:746 length:357 start_codon:yes stop_codon:yes gene_type:complete